MTGERHMVEGAPLPVGPFCHAAEADGWVLLTGQMPTDPGDPQAPVPDGIAAQTERVIGNLVLVLEGLGLTLGDVLQCRCYLTDFERDFPGFNAVYMQHFPEGARPARTTIGVTALALGALVEIDMVAKRP